MANKRRLQDSNQPVTIVGELGMGGGGMGVRVGNTACLAQVKMDSRAVVTGKIKTRQELRNKQRHRHRANTENVRDQTMHEQWLCSSTVT